MLDWPSDHLEDLVLRRRTSPGIRRCMETNAEHVSAMLSVMARHHGFDAPSRAEGPFLDHLETVFGGFVGARATHRADDYLYVEGNNDVLFLAHVDRIAAGSAVFRPDGEWVEGQLDNVVSTATLELLFESGRRPHVVFVTQEEIGNSDTSYCHFLADFPEAERLTLVAMDIDVAFGIEEDAVGGGMVSLRGYDSGALYHRATVAWARRLARAAGAAVHGLDGVWAIGDLTLIIQAGLGTGAFLGIPVLDYHSAKERTTAKAIRGFFAAACALSDATPPEPTAALESLDCVRPEAA